ncbi:GntR family transcriptional regulator [Propionivibrio dicarboxylicus]|uniref:DNA-binding transcriptional regulator, GntR family n=1 Tax=Propionivibrio dicarboxylicus TaxID=83767 RepID=A0A1G8KKY4_9RHOO|nr:GntR family transcriptional regulator [Propionivibrio dicarboxylicus]SDI44074.1 DNA-binding transcriptional regulator, GntR family [Propionivibrio dicarboxylicus]
MNAPKPSLVDRAYHELQDRILYCKWGEGFHALERDVVEELGLSRTTVRQALDRLQGDGLIKLVPRHGFHVLPVSRIDLQETYQVFTRLESLAVDLASARSVPDDELAALDSLNEAMDSAYGRADYGAWIRVDEGFHNQLVAVSGNQALVDIHRRFWAQLQRARLKMLSLTSIPAESTGQHERIVTAIRARDRAAAREALEGHFAHIVDYLARMPAPCFDMLESFSREHHDECRG